MLEHDKREFAEIYRGVCANYGREASREAMGMAWEALLKFDMAEVRRAYQAHVMTSKFMPSIAEVLDLINASNPAMRRPGADEAWARVPRSEDDSVVWTEEMAYAWSIATHLVSECLTEKPDWVAARMAFKDAYTGAVDTAKAQGRPVRWMVARGHRKDNLEDVLSEAVRLGRLTPEEARPHLLELEYVRPINQQLLLEGAARAKDDERAATLQALARFKSMLNAPAPEYDLDAVKAECAARDAELAAREADGKASAPKRVRYG